MTGLMGLFAFRDAEDPSCVYNMIAVFIFDATHATLLLVCRDMWRY